MRTLKTNDVYKMSKILKKLGLKVDTKDKNQVQLGAEMMLLIGENLHMVQDDVNSFLGELVGMTAEEFGDLPINEGLKYIEEFKNLPGINNFFKSADQLTK